MKHPAHIAVRMLGALLAAGCALAACGCSDDPTQGYTMQSPYGQSHKTVAVPIWQRGKDVYRRGLEFDLTEAIQKRIEQITPMKVVPRQRASTLLEGTIESVEQNVMSYDPNSGKPREQQIRMIVSFVWKDLVTGKELVRRDKFPVAATYIPAAPFNEEFFTGSQDVMQRLAERIVEQMEEPWGSPAQDGKGPASRP